MKERTIIDVSNTIPTRELLWDSIGFLPKIFLKRWGKCVGLSDEEISKLHALNAEEISEMFMKKCENRKDLSIEGMIQQLDEAGVHLTAIHNLDEETSTGMKPVPNEYIAEVMSKFPDYFIGFMGADPYKGAAAVKEIERGYRELALRAVVTRPYVNRVYANDRCYYPIYAKCEELGIPLWVHCTMNWDSSQPMDNGRPIYLDKVATHFPNLKIIAGHGGWPWVNEMVGLLWRHKNVYADISGHRFRYLAMPGSGWEMFFHYGNTVLQDKILFGSDWITLAIPIKKMLQEFNEIPLEENVKEKWLWGNARKLFALN